MAETISIDIIFNAINKAGNAFGTVNRGLNGMMNNMWRVNQAADLLDRTSTALNRLGLPGQEYDFGLAELSAITGIAGQELTDLGKTARKVGKESGLGATGSLEAYKLLASQIEVDKIGLQGLNELQKRTITLAQASPQLGLAGAANALAGTINQFGLEANQAGRVMNVLAAGSKYGAAEIPELAQSFKVVGAAASAAGLEVESTAGAIEVLSKNNLKGSEAGTALRNILLKMQTELGFDFKVTKLSDALATLQGKEGDAAYMAKTFGMENMAAAQFLIKNADAVEEMTKKVTGTTVATEQANIMNKTFTHRMDVMKAKLNDLSIGFFQHNQGLLGWLQIGGQAAATFTSLTPVIGIFGKGITSAFMGIGSFTKATRLMSAALAAGRFNTYSALIERYGMAGRIAAGGIWLKNQAVTFGTFISKLFNAETRKATLLQIWNGLASKAQAAWTWTVSAAQKVAAGATWLWNRALSASKFSLTGVIASTWAWTAALLANPITWIVAAILALVAGIALAWKHFDWFRGGIVGAWEAAKKFGQILWESIINPIKLMIAGVGKLIDAFGLLKKGEWKAAGATLKSGFGDIGKGMVQSTPVGVAMNVVKRSDEMGEAWNTGYQRGKDIDTSNFLSFGNVFNRAQEQPVSANDMQVPGFDQANAEVNVNYNTPGKVINMTPTWLPDVNDYNQPNYVNSPSYLHNEKHNNNSSVVNNTNLEQLTNNLSRNITNSSVTNQENRNQESSIQINYQPQIQISAELSAESRDNLMKMLNADKDKLMKLIKEELRKEGRLSYAG